MENNFIGSYYTNNQESFSKKINWKKISLIPITSIIIFAVGIYIPFLVDSIQIKITLPIVDIDEIGKQLRANVHLLGIMIAFVGILNKYLFRFTILISILIILAKIEIIINLLG